MTPVWIGAIQLRPKFIFPPIGLTVCWTSPERIEPSIYLDKAQMYGLVLAEEFFEMRGQIGRWDGFDLDATLQESTFPFSANLGIHGSGVIRNEQTHPRFHLILG